MATYVFIVQGEGRGHMSQSLALAEYLKEKGHTVGRVYAGCGIPARVPDYFREAFGESVDTFYSPRLLPRPNRKGIYVGRTLLYNLTRSLKYLNEARRLRREINALEPDAVFNFYDVVGALAMRGIDAGIGKIGIGHHFFLHLDGYRCGRSFLLYRWLLAMHTRMIMKPCDRVLALSFRETEGNGKIRVIPPLVRKAYRDMVYRPGDRYLVYFLHEGYLYDLAGVAEDDPGFRADVFSERVPEISLPSGLRQHPLSGKTFRDKMATCKGLIATAGFDAIAEAAYHGIPLVVVPARNHYEQLCNSRDVERSGLGISAEVIVPGIQDRLETGDHRSYKSWVDRAGVLMDNAIQEYYG